jgi:N-acetyltransferase
MQLAGRHVTLVPLTPDDAADLYEAAASESRETYAYAPIPASLDEANSWVQGRLLLRDQGSWYPYTTRLTSTGQLIGSTSFLNIERWDWPLSTGQPDSAEIGSTWLLPSHQRTPANTEAKYLMMTHAFETWGVQRLQIKTDARNARSRAAIERLGASFEGVLRHYQAGNGDVGAGAVRDTAMYSVLPSEWPTIKSSLEARLVVRR